MKKPFLETTWSKVEAGDTVLLPLGPKIVQARVEGREEHPAAGGKVYILVHFNPADLPNPHGFGPGDTAYVQSRI